MSFHYKIIFLLLVVFCLVGKAEVALAGCNNCEFIGNFRNGYEPSNAVDGDWETWTAPDEYGDSASIIEEFNIPSSVTDAYWNFKCYRNNIQIEVRAYYWNYNTSNWQLFYEVPYYYDSFQLCSVQIPEEALTTTPLRIKMFLKNAVMPMQSAEYYEGAVDWINPLAYDCYGEFRTGYECENATDGDWITWTAPDAYNDTASIVEEFEIPSGANSAIWNFRCIRNTTNIEINALYWNNNTSSWIQFYEVPYNLNYQICRIPLPAEALNTSPLKIRMHLKNAGSLSSEYSEAALDWVYDCSNAETLILGKPEYVTSLYAPMMYYPVYLDNNQPITAGDFSLCYNWPFDPDSISFECGRTSYCTYKFGDINTVDRRIRLGFVADESSGDVPLAPVDEFNQDSCIAKIYFILNCDIDSLCNTSLIYAPDTCATVLSGDTITVELSDTLGQTIYPEVVFEPITVEHYRPGDANGDCKRNISDAVYIISYVFSGGDEPVCDLKSGDANGDGNVNISDAVYLINYVFSGGSEPLPFNCQNDPNCYTCGEEKFFKLSSNQANLKLTAQEDGLTKSLIISSEVHSDIQAVQIEINPEAGIQIEDIVNLTSDLQMYQTTDNGLCKIGLIDINANHVIKAGQNDLIEVIYSGDAQLDVSDVILVGTDSRELQVNIEYQKSLPNNYTLDQNYPNPFNPETEISYSLLEAGNVKLEVFNIMGQKVTSLVNQYQDAGSYTVTWNSRNQDGIQVSSGIYFYKLNANNFAETKKMILMK